MPRRQQPPARHGPAPMNIYQVITMTVFAVIGIKGRGVGRIVAEVM